ncbi:MAG: glycosyltransferase family 9 protein [Bacteroidales bacterium]
MPLLEANPNLDKIIGIEKEKDVGGLMQQLRAEGYDYIVDLHKNLRSWRVLLSLMKPFGTFSKLNIRKFLICRLKIDLLPRIHIVDRYFQAVRSLGVTNDGKGLDYFLPDGTNPWQKIPGLPREGFVALVIGGKHATKQLPKERLLELCLQTMRPIVILGGTEDKLVGDYLVKTLAQGEAEPAAGALRYNTCGLLNLNESAALLKAAERVITHDTGFMHIAAAFSKDIVSVWGNTIPEFGMYPYFPNDYKGKSLALEVKGLSCRPCSKLGHPQCPKNHFRCMRDIDLKGI